MRITVLLTAKPATASGLKAFRFGTGADHDHLHRVQQQALQREAVAAGVEAEVLHDSSKSAQRIFGDFAVFRAPIEGFKAQQCGGSGGIAGGRGRILQRLAARAQCAQRRSAVRWRGGVVEALPPCGRRSAQSWHRPV